MKVYEDIVQHCIDGSTNPQWLDLRAGHFTGSDFHQYMGLAKKPCKLSETAKKELYKKVLENFGYRFETFQTPAMLIGIEREPTAREAYSFIYGKDVKEVGFVDKEELHAGCSPDGIIYDGDRISEIVEIKCPSVETFISYLEDDFMKPEYATQVQFNMFITGADVCHFVVYHPDFNLIVRDIPKDPAVQEKIEAVLKELSETYDEIYKQVEKQRLETEC